MHAQRIAKKLALVASLAGCGGYDGEGVEGLPDEQESLTSRALEDAEEAGIAASNVTVLVNRAAGAAGAAAGDNSSCHRSPTTAVSWRSSPTPTT